MVRRPAVALIPLDDRPVTCGFPARLARLAGWRPLLPPRSVLGHFLRPGDARQAASWLQTQAARADAVCITLEGLVFGGLVASREPGAAAMAPEELAGSLRALRAALGRRPVRLTASLMRLSITGRSSEHLRWWSAIHRWSELWEPADPAEAAERRRLEREIPRELLHGYLEARRAKHAFLRTLVELVAEGTVDLLLLFQEDCTPRGPHRQEQAELQELAAALGVADRVHVLPGTDEGLMLLVARTVLAGSRPARVRVRYTDPARAGYVAAFEDRPVRDTVTSQLAAVGAEPCADGALPDLVLVVHPPVRPGADHLGAIRVHGADAGAGGEDDQGYGRRGAAAVRDALAAGAPVAVVDAAYANGADPELLQGLAEDAGRLAAYAGWNTAANSVGTAVAWGLIRARCGGPEAWQQALLAERVADDGLYQVEVRPGLNRWLAERGWDPWNLRTPAHHARASRELARRLLPRWAEFWAARFPAVRLARCRLPWPRTFECALEVELR